MVIPPIRNSTDFRESNDEALSDMPEPVRRSRRNSPRKDAPSKYPVARILITFQRVVAIMIAALWPIEAIYIALGTDLKPVEKIVWIFGLLVGHLFGILGILLLAELLQAFVDIAKNTQATADSIIAFRITEKIHDD
jgi:hypothetical protein